MTDAPSPESILNFEGPKGESLFRRLLVWCLPAELQLTIQKEMDEVFSHLGSEDDRAVALVGALVVEDGVNRLVAAHAPGYNALAAKRDFSLSMRIELARALRLCPSSLLGAADTVRNIRNEFAHKLELTAFDGCKTQYLQAAKDHLKQIQPTMVVGKSDREVFRNLVTMVYLALRGYTFHVARLNQYIREEPSFWEALRKHCVVKYPQISASSGSLTA